MSCNPCQTQTISCPNVWGCPDNVCPDMTIKRHDTKPSFSVVVADCDGPLDLTNVIVEVSMWAKAKLKTAIGVNDTAFALADNIGFEQSLAGDILVMNRARNPEQMLITGYDEDNKLLLVQRGYHGTPISKYNKGTHLRIFRTLNSFGETVMVTEDETSFDGSIASGVLKESRVVYNWLPNDTCLQGCYWLEFKLLKMNPLLIGQQDQVQTSVTPTDCRLGQGVEWERKIPTQGEGFLVKIYNTLTSENLMS